MLGFMVRIGVGKRCREIAASILLGRKGDSVVGTIGVKFIEVGSLKGGHVGGVEYKTS